MTESKRSRSWEGRIRVLTPDYDISDIVCRYSSVTLDPFLDLSSLQVVPYSDQLVTLHQENGP